jgi:hypothetical protein
MPLSRCVRARFACTTFRFHPAVYRRAKDAFLKAKAHAVLNVLLKNSILVNVQNFVDNILPKCLCMFGLNKLSSTSENEFIYKRRNE